jgi:hypothetical protein
VVEVRKRRERSVEYAAIGPWQAVKREKRRERRWKEGKTVEGRGRNDDIKVDVEEATSGVQIFG